MIHHAQLISLIKSLTPSEKGYLKKLFSVHHANQFKHDFELLEKEILDQEKINNTKNGIDYSELFDFVLNSIEDYHKSTGQDARSIMNQIEILVDKNLYQQADKQVNRVKSLAVKDELSEQLIEVLEWEMAMLAIKAPTIENERKFESIFDQINETIKKQKDTL